MGFEADVKDPSGNKKTELTKQVTSHDLVKFGIIPELVGRIPVVTVLEELDESNNNVEIHTFHSFCNNQYDDWF